jgi:hypothetical protein
MRKDTSRSLRFNRRITDRVLSMSRQKVSRLLRKLYDAGYIERVLGPVTNQGRADNCS